MAVREALQQRWQVPVPQPVPPALSELVPQSEQEARHVLPPVLCARPSSDRTRSGWRNPLLTRCRYTRSAWCPLVASFSRQRPSCDARISISPEKHCAEGSLLCRHASGNASDLETRAHFCSEKRRPGGFPHRGVRSRIAQVTGLRSPELPVSICHSQKRRFQRAGSRLSRQVYR